MSDYDFVVIGGGSAGYNAAATAAKLGLKTAVIDIFKKVAQQSIVGRATFPWNQRVKRPRHDACNLIAAGSIENSFPEHRNPEGIG